MNVFETVGLKVLIVRPGATELDEQGRIAGTLDLPLSHTGVEQISKLAKELDSMSVDKIFAGPGAAAKQTAELLASRQKVKVRQEDDLRNLDYGLWHGKRLDELKETQPKLVKMWQDQPHSIRPPNGETVEDMVIRVERFVKKLVKKNKTGSLIVVTAEPVACVVKSLLENADISENWTMEANSGTWDAIVTGDPTAA